MSESVLQVDQHDAVRVLRLDRPGRKNALSSELGWAIVEAVQEAARDDAVRAIGITGNGDAFCSGVDLAPQTGPAESPLTDSDRTVDDLGWIGRLPLLARFECDKPIVAGVNGVAVGAGMSLAMCADLRVASSVARFHPGYARAATSPDGGLSWTLPQALGHERAMRFLLDPRFVPADEALSLGIVGEVAPEAEFEEQFMARCQGLADLAPIASRQTKRLVSRAGVSNDLEGHLRDELHYVHRGLDSEDGKEAVAAIMEKRAPVFRGR
jgi:2-(1,2-epoxy-1,2-dihydrophenyl)acetyl-CoA isomerase